MSESKDESLQRAEEIARRLDREPPRKEREAALGDLIEICRGSEAARERYLMRFVTLLADDAPYARGLASLGVVLCDDNEQHVERVVRLLGDPSPGVRLQAIHALAPLGLASLHDRFAESLHDPDRLVRLAAAVALAAGGDLRGTDVLLEAIARRSTRLDALLALRRAAADGPDLRAKIEPEVRKIFGGFLTHRFDRVAAAAVLATMGIKEGGDHLIERARKGGVERPMALELCGELQIPGGEAVAAAIAADKDDALRGTALRALASYDGASAADLCSRALLDEGEDADVRCDAAEGLLLLGTDAARRSLEEAREGPGDERVRRVAATCLSLFGRPSEEVRLYLPLSGEEVIS